jgi:hypothetical protein
MKQNEIMIKQMCASATRTDVTEPVDDKLRLNAVQQIHYNLLLR